MHATSMKLKDCIDINTAQLVTLGKAPGLPTVRHGNIPTGATRHPPKDTTTQQSVLIR